jgi:hypothetical protein
MRRFAVISVFCALIFGIVPITSQAKEKAGSSPVAGTWTCVAHGGENGDIPFTLSIQQTAEGLTGTVSAPQGDANLTSVTFNDNQIKIAINTDEHSYALNATLADGKLAGEWYRDGQKQGTWEGKK